MTEEIKAYYNKAASYCSGSEHCLQEVREKLTIWGAPSDCHDEITEMLMDEGFIDEARYASAYVSDKFRFNHWGRKKIAYALKGKGIASSTISDALGNINEEEYHDILEALICSKRKSLHGEYVSIKTKLFKFAAARGFEPEIVMETIRKSCKGQQ